MGRTRNIGKVEPVPKVWLTKKELAAYLGVSERYIETAINNDPRIDLFRLSNKIVLYDRSNIDAVIRRSKV